MKKIRLNLKRGVKSWSFTLYDSVESAYYLKDEPVMDDEVEEYRRVVTVKRGEIIEAEWLGAEWVYDEDVGHDSKQYRKFDRVRLGKISNLKHSSPGTTSTKYLELYSGWVSNVEFPWTPDDSRGDIKITRINGKSASKLDFSKLFLRHSDETEEDLDSLDPEYEGEESRFIN